MQEKNQKQLLKKQKKLLNEIKNIDNFCRGTVVLLKQSCSRKKCKKCLSGEKHPQYYLSQSRNGKSKIIFLGKKKKKKVEELVNNYKKIKQLMYELSDINTALIKTDEFISAN